MNNNNLDLIINIRQKGLADTIAQITRQLNKLNSLSSPTAGSRSLSAGANEQLDFLEAAQTQAGARAAQTQQKAATTGILAGNELEGRLEQVAQAELIANQKRLSAKVQEQLALNTDIAKSTVQEKKYRDQIATDVARQARATRDDQGRITKSGTSVEADRRLEERRTRDEVEQTMLRRTTPADRADRANLEVARRDQASRQEAANLKQMATKEGQAVRNREARNKVAQEGMRIEQEINVLQRKIRSGLAQQAAELEFEKRRFSAAREAALGTEMDSPRGTAILEQEGRNRAGTARRNALRDRVENEARAADRDYIRETAAAAKARRQQKARIQLAEAGEDPFSITGPDGSKRALEGEELEARAAVASRARADRMAAAQAQLTTQADVQASVQKRVQSVRLTQQMQVLERAYIREALATGAIGGGSRFQRLQARFSPTARLPEEFQGLGQFVGSKMVTTAGYALGGAAAYGAFSGISTMLREATELDSVLNQINAQLRSIGQGEFVGEVRSEILDIAKDTGVAADEVGGVAFQLIGAFSQDGGVPKAMAETRAAMKLTRVTGLELAEVTDSLIAITHTYGVTMEDVGDIAIFVEQQFGVLARETISFLGDTAAVAKTAGLGLEEFAVIAGAAQQASGRSGTAIGEGLNRILPSIQDNSSEILSLYTMLREQSARAGGDSAMAFSEGYDNILASMSRGQTGEAFLQIIRDFDAMSKAQQNAIVTQLGGRREAQTLIPILEQSKRIISEIEALEAGDQSQVGLMNQRFMDFEETVQNAGARLRETFMQIGEMLFESGIADGLVIIMDGLQGIVSIGMSVVGVFEAINAAIPDFGTDNGLLMTMTQYAALAFLMQKAFGVLAGTRAKDAVAALGQDAAQQKVNMGLVQGTASTTTYANTVRGKTAVVTQDTAAVEMNARANMGARISGAFPSLGAYRAGRAADLSRGASLSAAAAPPAGSGGALAGIGAAGAFMVYSQYQTIGSDLAKAEEDLRAKMSQANREDLKKIAATRTGFWASVGLKLWGEDLPEDIAQQELNSQEVAPETARIGAVLEMDKGQKLAESIDVDAFDRMIQNSAQGDREAYSTYMGTIGYTPVTGNGEVDRAKLVERLEEELPELQRRADDGDAGAKEIIEFLTSQLDSIDALATLRKKVDEALGAGDVEKAMDEAGGIGNLIALKVSELKNKRDVGFASDREVIDGAIRILEQQRSTATTFAGEGGLTPEQMEQFASAEREVTDLILGGISDRASSYERLARVDPGGAEARSQDLEARLAALATSPNVNGAGREQVIDQWMELLDERFERELAGIANEELRALREQEGYEIPDGLRTLLVESELGLSDEFVGFLEPLSSALNIRQDQISADIAELVAETDLSVREALLAYINAQLAALMTAGGSSEAIKSLEEQRSRVQSAPDINVSAFERVFGDAKDNLEDAKKKEDAYWDSYFDYQMALAEGNPVAEAQVGIQKAARQLEEARQSGDPNEIRSANAAMLRANRSMQEARNDIVRAQLESAQVLADGDPIRETAAALELAAFDLREAAGRGDAAGAQRARNEIMSLNQRQRDNFVDAQRANMELMAASTRDPLEQARWAVAIANLDVANATGGADQDRAKIAQAQAVQGEQDQLVDIQRARMEYAAALVANDPVAAAEAAVKQADFEFANAQGEAAKIRAKAQQIQANFQLSQVIQDIVFAQIELAQAFAEAAGEGVDVARLGLTAALKRLENARAAGMGDSAIARAQADVIKAQAAMRDAEFSDRLGDIDFLLQIGDITTAQAIQMLESLAQIPDLTEEQLRQIRLKIKSLQDDLSSNFQFNLPTNLRLPTLYEARRLDQSSSQGIGYQDNRTVDIRISVNNGADEERMVSILEDALNTNRFGSVPGRY